MREMLSVESFEAAEVLICWLFFFHRWAGFHPHTWKKMSKVQTAPKSPRRDKEKPALCYELTEVFRKQHFWLFNTSLLFFFLLSLNAGISKDAGPDRLMACLEQCKKQPASLSLSGTGAKPKAFLPQRALQIHQVRVVLLHWVRHHGC